MKTPRDYLSERYRSLNLTDSLAAAFVLVLLIVAIWPHSRLVTDLVLVTAIPGLIAAVVWILTFWQKARVQIGRLKLRYKPMRRIAGIAALFCLRFCCCSKLQSIFRGRTSFASAPSMLPDSRNRIRSMRNGRFASQWRSLISKATKAIR